MHRRVALNRAEEARLEEEEGAEVSRRVVSRAPLQQSKVLRHRSRRMFWVMRMRMRRIGLPKIKLPLQHRSLRVSKTCRMMRKAIPTRNMRAARMEGTMTPDSQQTAFPDVLGCRESRPCSQRSAMLPT